VVLDVDDGTFDNILTVPKALLTERICILDPSRMRQVCQAWRDAADC